MSRYNQEWTTTERATLLDLRAKGFTARQITEHLPGRTKRAIDNFIAREGLPRIRKPYRYSEPVPKPPREALAAAKLARAINAAVLNFAAASNVGEQEARAFLFGDEKRQKSPGSEVVHKSQGMARQVKAVFARFAEA